MAHFARVEKGIVIKVIVAEQDFINSEAVGDPLGWIQTSYNTHGGVHLTGGEELRKNFAGIGYTYDSKRDSFIAPKKFESWILNEKTCLYEPPIPCPKDGEYYGWNEENKQWDLIEGKPIGKFNQ